MMKMPAVGDIIDEKYEVTEVFNESGGMGLLLLVEEVDGDSDTLVLKYCKATDDPSIKRFQRESRLLAEFQGNSKVAQLQGLNPRHDPPYYVMNYYRDGDLTTLQEYLQNDDALQESTFLQMVDCVAELHDKQVFHRDIKPQNFLRDNGAVVVSDLGLSMERESLTKFTTSADVWGTQGYVPPEYIQSGGFKDADAAGDIFMLGKSFYVLLTDRDPLYLLSDDIHPAIYHVISRCCDLDKNRRYQRLADLQQAIVFAYDAILDRVEGFSEVRRILDSIMERLKTEGKYSSQAIIDFMEKLALLRTTEQDEITKMLRPRLFRLLGGEKFITHLDSFLDLYDGMVRRDGYGWSFSETVADCAEALITAGSASPKAAARMLDAAIYAAVTQNQFAAMDTCRDIIVSLNDESYAMEARAVLLKYAGTFVAKVEPIRCKNRLIGEAVSAIR